MLGRLRGPAPGPAPLALGCPPLPHSALAGQDGASGHVWGVGRDTALRLRWDMPILHF